MESSNINATNFTRLTQSYINRISESFLLLINLLRNKSDLVMHVQILYNDMYIKCVFMLVVITSYNK